MFHQPIRALALLSAITKNNATIYDLTAELRRLGLSFSDSQLLEKMRTKIDSNIVQRVPQIPFSLNGTMYDPKDIIRFNGQELHFVLAPSDDHMLVVDNIELLNIWGILANHEMWEYQTMRQPVPIVPSIPIPPPGGGDAGAELPGFGLSLPPYYPPSNLTHVFQRVNYKGYPLSIRGRVNNLRGIRMGFGSHWDKQISSLSNDGYSRCRLYEDYDFRGASLTTIEFQNISDLGRLGWDNRASSVWAGRNI